MPLGAVWTGRAGEPMRATIAGLACEIVQRDTCVYEVWIDGRLARVRTTYDRARNSASWYANHPEEIRSPRMRSRTSAIPAPNVSTGATNYRQMSTRKFGVEIEMSRCDVPQTGLASDLNTHGIVCVTELYNHQLRNHWKIVHDATVSFGELVSPPLSGQNGLDQLMTVGEVLHARSCTAGRNAGLHVHVDAHDITFEQLRNICRNWVIAQPLFDQFVSVSRRDRNNEYCLPNTGTPEQIMIASDQPQLITTFTYGTRYRKLNLESLARHGTIEFRLHHGTTRSAHIIEWVRFINLFVEASIEMIELPTNCTHTQLYDLIGADPQLVMAMNSRIRYFSSRQTA